VALGDGLNDDTKSIPSQELRMNVFSSFYVAAVVNANQYISDRKMRYILGAGDSTTDADGFRFYNREVKGNIAYFFRVFSISSTSEVCSSLFYYSNCDYIFIVRMRYQPLQMYRNWVSILTIYIKILFCVFCAMN